MSNVFIEEFLYRGKGTDSPEDDTWHVVLGREVTDIAGNKKLETHGPLTPERARELGHSLETILPAINQNALDEVERLRAELENLQTETQNMRAKVREISDQLTKEQSDHKKTLIALDRADTALVKAAITLNALKQADNAKHEKITLISRLTFGLFK